MPTTRRAVLAGTAALPFAAPALVRAQPAGDVVRIGVLTDLHGPYLFPYSLCLWTLHAAHRIRTQLINATLKIL